MRSWTRDEVTLFAEVLSEDKVNFADCLKKWRFIRRD